MTPATVQAGGVRYVDSGSRDPDDALGSWLVECASRSTNLTALRFQSGFFGDGSLPFLAPLIARLRESDGIIRVLIGSNEGATRSGDVSSLLELLGPPGPSVSVGVVNYDRGFFHPKTVHLSWDGNTASAYVGSANLTGDGVTSLHVEAGILLDSADGDDASVLDSVATSVDDWFVEDRPGLHIVSDPADVAMLVADGILDAPRPALPRQRSGTTQTGSGPRLSRLIPVPTGSAGTGSQTEAPSPIAPPPSPSSSPVVAEWSKLLSPSDAQRKAAGNQRGSITLVKAGHDIDPQSYFRFTFFSTATWVAEPTRTGEVRESAVVEFDTNVLGVDLGVLRIPVTYASNREADQANYTSLLHLGPLTEAFAASDMTNRSLVLRRRANGTFALTIT